MQKMFRSKLSMITYILSFCFLFVGTSLVFASLPIKAEDGVNYDSYFNLCFTTSAGGESSHTVHFDSNVGWPQQLDEYDLPYIPEYYGFEGWYDGEGGTGNKCYDEYGLMVPGCAQNTEKLYPKLVLDLWTDYAVKPSGSGSQENPYKIASAENLAWLAREVNNGNLKGVIAYYEQTNNIDLSGHYWVPIGTESNPFYGAFTGAKNTIYNMRTISSPSYIGLFGYCSINSMVHFVYLHDSQINVFSSSASGAACVGGVVGYTESQLCDCRIYNVHFYIRDYACVGGVVGESAYSGGGRVYGVVACMAENSSILIKETISYYVGGIAGKGSDVGLCGAYKMTITDQSGSLGEEKIGGVVGFGDADSCYFRNGEIIVKSSPYVNSSHGLCYAGGIAASGNDIKECSFEDSVIDVTVNNTLEGYEQEDYDGFVYVGGIAGTARSITNGKTISSEIKVAYSLVANNVTITNEQNAFNAECYVGGIVGELRTSISDCLTKDSDVNVDYSISANNVTITRGDYSFDVNVYVGGITGHGGASNCIVSASNINSVYTGSISSVNYAVAWYGVGGVAGYGSNVTNCQVSECDVVAKRTLKSKKIYTQVGGLTGRGGGSNSFVCDSTIKGFEPADATNYMRVGGVSSDDSPKNCLVKNCKIYALSNDSTDDNFIGLEYAGGIVGSGDATGCQAYDCEIIGKYAGGISGRLDATLKITNCVVSNCESNGGIVGYYNHLTTGNYLGIEDCLYIVGENSPLNFIGAGHRAGASDVVCIIEKNINDISAFFSQLSYANCLLFECNLGNFYYTGKTKNFYSELVDARWDKSSLKIVNGQIFPLALAIAAGGEDVTTAKLAGLGYIEYSAT
ncbi:MAG: hypothetical protein E7379_02245 [Clostridiales bacterium]|nr:hypothetical protein [Clostridiales bacterium]